MGTPLSGSIPTQCSQPYLLHFVRALCVYATAFRRRRRRRRPWRKERPDGIKGGTKHRHTYKIRVNTCQLKKMYKHRPRSNACAYLLCACVCWSGVWFEFANCPDWQQAVRIFLRKVNSINRSTLTRNYKLIRDMARKVEQEQHGQHWSKTHVTVVAVYCYQIGCINSGVTKQVQFELRF